MIITHSQMDLAASHRRSESYTQRESIHLFEISPEGQLKQSVQLDDSEVKLSQRAVDLAAKAERQGSGLERDIQKALQAQQEAARLQAGDEDATESSSHGEVIEGFVAVAEPSSIEVTSPFDSHMSLIKEILEFITGRELQVFNPFSPQQLSAAAQPATPVVADAAPSAQAGSQFGIRYQYSEIYQEQEQTAFSATGAVTTADGRTLSIDFELNMSRSFMRQNHLQIEAGARLKDPLVINFDGPAAELTQQKYSFDIDADGSEEQISFVSSHSGFLALDRNDDGVINDGSELFGALSGQGFDELSHYDQDGNGFIDEGDAIYQSLRIWVKQEDGTDQLLALGDKNIGAIYLGSTETDFDIKNADNELLGKVRSTGVFLTEDGAQGSVQQIDLAV